MNKWKLASTWQKKTKLQYTVIIPEVSNNKQTSLPLFTLPSNTFSPIPPVQWGHVTRGPCSPAAWPLHGGLCGPSCWLSVKHLQRNFQPGRPRLLPLWSGKQQLLLHTAALCSRLLTTLCPTAQKNWIQCRSEGRERRRGKIWRLWRVGVEEKKRKRKNLPVFSSTKTSTSSDNGSGGFSWPRHSSKASPSWRFTLPSLLRDMIVIVQISQGEKNGPGPSLPQASTHLYERDLIVATQHG